MSRLKCYSSEEVSELVRIGFCQSQFYKRDVWRKAKKLMDQVVVPNGWAQPFNFGRGKGKYRTPLDIETVQSETINFLRLNGRIVLSPSEKAADS